MVISNEAYLRILIVLEIFIGVFLLNYMETKFEIGQKVYDSVFFGSAEGIVKNIKDILNKTVLEISFEGITFRYNHESKFIDRVDDRFITSIPTLSTKPYTLEGFTQESIIDWSKYFNTWGIFYDEEEDFESANRVGRLHDYDNDNIYPFQTYGGESYMNFKPLTEEQIKIIDLK